MAGNISCTTSLVSSICIQVQQVSNFSVRGVKDPRAAPRGVLCIKVWVNIHGVLHTQCHPLTERKVSVVIGL